MQAKSLKVVPNAVINLHARKKERNLKLVNDLIEKSMFSTLERFLYDGLNYIQSSRISKESRTTINWDLFDLIYKLAVRLNFVN